MGFCKSKCSKCVVISLSIGILFIIAGGVLGFVVFPHLLKKLIAKNVQLEEDTLTWYRFKEIPFPLDFKVTFFTIENAEDTLLHNAKPIVKEQGPYFYSERRSKINATIEGTEASYSDVLTFEFNANASYPLKEGDTVNVLNVPLVGILQSLENVDLPFPTPVETILMEIFETTQIFLHLKVSDYTFGGVKMCDPKNVKSIASKFICLSAMLMNLKALKYNEDRSMSFSLLYYKTKPDGPFTLNTGTEDIDSLGLLTSYKGRQFTEIWKGDESSCDAVSGRATTFAPFVKPEGEMKMYSTDICKSATIHFTEKSTFKDVESYTFQMKRESFTAEDQRNTCACIDRTKGLDGKSHCYNDGVIDLYNCVGAPIIMSFPQLMWTKKEYQESIDGLRTKEAEENSSNYTTELQLQPHTGIPLRVGLNVQMNMILRPTYFNNKIVRATENLRPAFFPIVWVQESAELSDKLLEELKSQLLNNLFILEVLKWCLIGVGLFVVLIGLGCFVLNLRRQH